MRLCLGLKHELGHSASALLQESTLPALPFSLEKTNPGWPRGLLSITKAVHSVSTTRGPLTQASGVLASSLQLRPGAGHRSTQRGTPQGMDQAYSPPNAAHVSDCEKHRLEPLQ